MSKLLALGDLRWRQVEERIATMPLDGDITDHALPKVPSRVLRLTIYGGAICLIGLAAYAYLVNV